MSHLLLSCLIAPLLAFQSCQNAPAPAASVTAGADSASQARAVAAPPADAAQQAEADLLAQTIYTQSDSLRVVQLLRTNPGDNDVLFYARQFLGLPYVGGTLEKADPERLVVNLRQLDCTTLVETVWALALTRREGSDRFADYCRNLRRLRYWGGEMDGYLSRLHYFTWWMHDNLRKGIMVEVADPAHCTAVINVENHYMSAHPDKYRFLKAHPEWVDSIARLEARHNGPDGRYLPAAATARKRSELSFIHDGDLVAIVTSKDGLDYSHLGFAVWGKDGLLHLLNASSIHHKVVEEPKTLRQYLREHPSSIGIRLFRLVP